jgi:SAM-dependent methyltransferase
VKCSGCGLLYVNPRPGNEEIDNAQTYGVHKGESTIDNTGEFKETKVISYLSVLKDIYGTELRDKKRTWLDIGCGHGEFIMALQKVSDGSATVSGLEPNIRKQKSALARGLDVSYYDLANHKKLYDCVSLLNVYSHLSEPVGFINQCKAVLKPKGELLLETGDTANLSAEEHYRPFYLPDHLSFASEEIISNILNRFGLKIIGIKKFHVFGKYMTDMYVRAQADN